MVLGLLGPAGLLHRSGSSCGTNSFVAWKAQRTRVLATKRSYVRTRRLGTHRRPKYCPRPRPTSSLGCIPTRHTRTRTLPRFHAAGSTCEEEKRRGETVVDENKQQRHPWKGKVRPRWTTFPVPPPRCLRTYHPSVVVGTGQFGEIGTTERAENNRYQKQ